MPDKDREPDTYITAKRAAVQKPSLPTSDTTIVLPRIMPPIASHNRTQEVSQPQQGAWSGTIAETPLPVPALLPASLPATLDKEQTIRLKPTTGTNLRIPAKTERDRASARMLRKQCQHLCLSLFFREVAPVRSLGFTSAVAGEGKSFLAMVMAGVLANNSSSPVTWLECNWEHPFLHEFYGIPETPGLAEFLRGECHEKDIRHQVERNLTIIPAGDGERDAVKLLLRLRQNGLLQMFTRSNELLIVDLPAITSVAYGQMAASLAEALILVVRAGVTPEATVKEVCEELKDLPLHGVILNQLENRVPGWIQKLL